MVAIIRQANGRRHIEQLQPRFSRCDNADIEVPEECSCGNFTTQPAGDVTVSLPSSSQQLETTEASQMFQPGGLNVQENHLIDLIFKD
ncbi:hypothetical protein RRG08_036062 [Elysia crispata]|uniref:Uncharacterized protein n=1 Tax=Elysia crispata TaxID=231223 RepID=A0AAE1AKU0_9GAST|nr:hypothetical protein RRG08_036062 [Elysia crispata]